MAEQSLSSLFHQIETTYNSSLINGFATDDDRLEFLSLILNTTLPLVHSQGIFSKNDSLDDIATTSIPYKSLYYYVGKAYQQCTDQTRRYAELLKAKEYYLKYLNDCQRIGILDEQERKFLEYYEDSEEGASQASRIPPQDKRQQKIEKYKRQKANKERIESLKRLLLLTKDDVDIDHESEFRELTTTQLKYFAQDCTDEIPLIDQELPLLQMREMELLAAQAQREQDLRDGKPSSPSSSSSSSSRPPQRGEGPGIKIITMNKIGDEIITTRDVFRANVFGSSIAPPTMTLEEFADLEVQRAHEREEKEKAASLENRVGGRYDQLLAEGLEDDEDLVDESAKYDREWDDWKDNNPKGWGNKMGKRF